jgi:hypothetical protein
MNKFLILIFYFTSVLCVQGLAIDSALLKTLTKYSEANGIKAQFIKTDYKKTLGTKKSVPGEMKYSNGKINITISSDLKSEIIYNGRKLWIIEYPDLDFNPKGHRKVTEINNHKPALAQQIVGLFQNPNKFLKKFKIISEKSDGKMKTAHFESKDKGIQNFQVEYSTKKQLINSIRFVDDVQTETHIEFSKTEFLKKAPTGAFEYKSKKDDEVM